MGGWVGVKFVLVIYKIVRNYATFIAQGFFVEAFCPKVASLYISFDKNK